MTSEVEKIVKQVETLPEEKLDEFLSWLADYEFKVANGWDRQTDEDAPSGGRLDPVLRKVRKDIAQGTTKPLDEILGHL